MSVDRISVPFLCFWVLSLYAALPPSPGVCQEEPGAVAGVPSDGPLTMDDAVAIALDRHPSLAIAKHGTTAARGGYVQARSNWLPSLDLRSDYSRSMTTGRAVVGGVPIGGGAERYATQ